MNHFAVAPDMGGGTRHIELGRELVRRHWNVAIVATDFNYHQRRYTRRSDAADRLPRHEVIDGVRMSWLWAPAYQGNDYRRVYNWLHFGHAVSRLDSTRTSADLVIGSTPHLFAALGALRLARRIGVPFVLEVRDLWPETLAVAGYRRGPGYHALGAVARHLYRNADQIIVLAEGVHRYLCSLGVEAERIVTVPNGVDGSAFRAPRRQPRDSVRLVYAGAHGPANGLDVVLEAAALLRDEPRVSFLFVGDGPARASLREQSDRLGLANVQFADSVPKSRMPAVLHECDAGLMILKDVPVFSFGVSPNKLFDYFGAGLPVVCNVRGDVAGCVTRARGGVQAKEPTGPALAEAIRTLLAISPDERVAMGERGRVWVLREHDRPVLAARLDAALRRVLAREARACAG